MGQQPTYINCKQSAANKKVVAGVWHDKVENKLAEDWVVVMQMLVVDQDKFRYVVACKFW